MDRVEMERLERCREKYGRITERLICRNQTVTAMESCTSGLIASLLTDREGASGILKGAFVTYCNEAKIRCGVPESVIAAYGVYSRETAKAMAEACRKSYCADFGIGVTGSLGRTDPRNPDSVSGQVYFAISREPDTDVFFLTGIDGRDRFSAKLTVAEKVADELLKLLES